ncbi:MAG TPA: hypothetical protein VN764_19220 [Polyangiaceae bacterium]|nr:hypothetical protein [Polyangiaceae bacterium]
MAEARTAPANLGAERSLGQGRYPRTHVVTSTSAVMSPTSAISPKVIDNIA